MSDGSPLAHSPGLEGESLSTHLRLVSFPDPFCARAKNLKLGGGERPGKGSGKSTRATVAMLERLEWNAVSVLCIRPTVLYSVART